MGSLDVGDKAPDFKTESSGGGFKSLKDYRGKYLVLYFYPKDNTPGCSVQSTTFTELSEDFNSLGAVVVGVSRDSIASHHKFIEKKSLSIELLSDPEEKLCNAFSVIGEKNMFGKKVKGIIRSTFLIDPKGKVVSVWRKVKVPGHCEEVLETMKELSGK